MKTMFFIVLVCLLWNASAQKPRLVVPVGHTGLVNSVAFSPNGRYVLTGSWDHTAKLWERESGKELHTFSGHTDKVNAVAFSPDGNFVLTGSLDKTAKLWDLSGKEIQTFEGHSTGIAAVSFSPDGKYVLTGANGKYDWMGEWNSTAKLWDMSGKIILAFGHTNGVSSVFFSPDGKYILTGSDDKTAKLWDLSGKEIQTFEGHSGGITSVAFSPDGKYVLTGSKDKTARLWDLSGKEIRTFSGHSQYVYSVIFSPTDDGKTILTGSSDKTANLWDITGKKIRTFRGHTNKVVCAVFSPDGKYVLTGAWDKTVRLWDMSGKEIQTFTGHSNSVASVAFSPDGISVFTGSNDNIAKLWDLSGREFRSFKGHSDWVSSVIFSPDGKYVLTGSGDSTANLWDITGRKVQTFAGHTDRVSSVAFSPDGKYVLTGSNDYTAKLWDLSGKEIRTFKKQSATIWVGGRVYSVAFSPDGQYILTGNNDDNATIWDLEGKAIHTFEFDKNTRLHWGYSVAFSPDGKYVLTGSGLHKTAILWDRSGEVLQTFKGHSGSVNSADFSPDGKYILTGSADNTARLWDTTGKEIRTFAGHTAGVNSVAFSPTDNGKYVLTGSDDGTIKLWDRQSGKERVTLIALDSVNWVVTTPSGLFDASPGAMQLIYYLIDLEVIELEQLKERYYEPGLLQKLFSSSEGDIRDVEGFAAVELYPTIRADITRDKLNIVLAERNGGLGQLSLFINDKEVQEDINPRRMKTLSVALNMFSKFCLTDTVNIIALRAYNAKGWLKSRAYCLDYRPGPPENNSDTELTELTPDAHKPALYALIIGSSNYAGERLDLRFADRDAATMAQAVESAGKALFKERTYVRLLSTAGKNAAEVPSKANIQAAFAEYAAQTKSVDVMLVYFSGHGVAYGPAEKSRFYYLTKDMAGENLDDPEIRHNYAVSSDELTQWLTAIPALKQVMIVDACNSGKVVDDFNTIASKELNPSQVRAFDRMKDRTGMFILTGSAADKVSYEAGRYGQGLLTYSLLQGMSGLALTDDKRVDVMTLFQYTRDEVPNLAKYIGGIQTPVLAFPAGGGSFDIGIVDAGVKIPLARVKPVFIRNVFQDEERFDDVIGLTDSLETYFRNITAKGAEADLIYVDVREYEDAYSMKGLYKISGDTVELRGRLFKGKTAVGDFQITEKKNALPALVEAIISKASEMITMK